MSFSPPPNSAGDPPQPDTLAYGPGDHLLLHTAAPSDLVLPSAPPPLRSETVVSFVEPPRGEGVPGYEVLEQLGRGGMGVVYKARQIKLNRLVALKMILAGDHAGEPELARFRTETEAVARLQHAHVVQVYEMGEHQGLPYFSMELCSGGTLADKLDGTPWQPHEGARLMAILARAMQAAHEAGIVHRDLKPANILLSADGTPKVSDFGLAKKLDEQGYTRTGAVMGTPSYMAPEQASGENKLVGPLADVYALGALLYELLTGRPPFRAATTWDTIRQVRYDEPVPVRRLQPRTPRDLETICLKCLQKQPSWRYDSAAALAEELERWLAGKPIQARPSGVGERVVKWAWRRPALAALLTVSAAAALALVVLLGALWRNAEERAAAVRKLQMAKAQLDEWQDRLGVLEKDVERQQNLLDEKRGAVQKLQQSILRHEATAKKARLSTRRALLVRDLHLARTAVDREQISRLRMLLERQLPPAGEPDLRGFGWHHLWRFCHDELLILDGHPKRAVCRGRFTPDGKELITMDGDAGIKRWDLAGGKERVIPLSTGGPFSHLAASVSRRFWPRALPVPTGKAFTGVAVSPDGRTIVAGTQDGTVLLWDANTGKRKASGKTTGAVFSLALNRAADKLALSGAEGIIRVWDVPSFKERQVLHGPCGRIENPTFSADGRLLATSHPDGTIKVWDLEAGREKTSFAGQAGAWMLRLAFSADGKTWATTEAHPFTQSLPGRVKIWDANTQKVRAALEVPHGGAWGVAFSPDERFLAVGADNGVVRLWDPASGQVRRTLVGHTHRVHFIAFSPAGNLLATGGNDSTIRLWDLAALPAEAVLPDICSRVNNILFSPDGKTLAAASEGGGVRLWDARTGRLKTVLRSQPGKSGPLAFSPDGKLFVSRGTDRDVRLWDLAQGRERAILRGHQALVTAADFSADGKTLATTADDHTIRFWDVASAKPRDILPTGLGPRSGGFTPQGHYLASVDGTIHLWDLQSKRSRPILPGKSSLYSVAVSPDGRLCAATDYGGWAVRLANLATGKELAVLKGHNGHVTRTAFTPDGKSLVSASEDGTIKFWDLATFQERFTLHDDEVWLGSVFALSPDGRTLAAWASDGKIHLWSATAAGRVPRPESIWHIEEAIDCLRSHRQQAALFHLRRLLAMPLSRELLAGEAASRHELAARHMRLAILLEQAKLRGEAEQIRQQGSDLRKGL